jgi:hypothetical protein
MDKLGSLFKLSTPGANLYDTLTDNKEKYEDAYATTEAYTTEASTTEASTTQASTTQASTTQASTTQASLKGDEMKFSEAKEMNKEAVFGLVVSGLLYLVAFYLSWSCNSKCFPGMSLIEKVLRALVAGFFGFWYIIVYFAFWSTDCNTCKPVQQNSSSSLGSTTTSSSEPLTALNNIASWF